MNRKILAILPVILLVVLSCGSMPPSPTPAVPTPTPFPSVTPASIFTASIKSTGEPESTLPPVEMYVTAAKALNVRKLPTEHSPSIGNILAGKSVNILADTTGKPVCENGWLRIEFEGRTAWVKADFISGTPCK